MPLNITIAGENTEVALKDFSSLAKALNFTPQAEAIAYGQGLAVELCRQAGVTVTLGQPGTAAEASAEPAGEPGAVIDAAGGGSDSGDEQLPPDHSVAQQTPVSGKKQKAEKKAAAKTQTLNDDISDVGGPAAVKPMSLDDVRVALRNLASKRDMPRCSALLAEFGAKKAMEVPVERIAEFVAKAAELAGA